MFGYPVAEMSSVVNASFDLLMVIESMRVVPRVVAFAKAARAAPAVTLNEPVTATESE